LALLAEINCASYPIEVLTAIVTIKAKGSTLKMEEQRQYGSSL